MNTGRTHFKKGSIPWNKGLKGSIPWNKGLTKETDERVLMSVTKGGMTKKGMAPWNKGKTGVQTSWRKGKHGIFSKETLEKMSEGQKARYAKGYLPWNKGKTGVYSEGTLEKIRFSRAQQKFPYTDSKIERKMYELLHTLNIKYQKHFPLYHPIMKYHQVDIMICDHEGNPKIAIECDGCYFHGCPIHCSNSKYARRERDMVIDGCLTEMGIKVIRFWEHDIKSNMIPLEVFR